MYLTADAFQLAVRLKGLPNPAYYAEVKGPALDCLIEECCVWLDSHDYGRVRLTAAGYCALERFKGFPIPKDYVPEGVE
jgi:hypothetical protein